MNRCTIIAACIATPFVSSCVSTRQCGTQLEATGQAARTLDLAVIEDDISHSNVRLTDIATDGCVTDLTSAEGRLKVDWSRPGQARAKRCNENRPTGTRLLHIGEQAFSRADIQRVAMNFDERGFAVLDIEMTQEAATRLHTETVRPLNTDISLRIDENVLSTARLVEPLADGRLRISGAFSVAEIEAMAKSTSCGLGLSSSQYAATKKQLRC